MINIETCQAVWNLYQTGMPLAEISRRLDIDRKTIRTIIARQGALPLTVRKDAVELDEVLLRETYKDCAGWVERTHEVLEGKGVKIGYSTLTRRIRELGLGNCEKERAQKVPDMPGAEFQHDTSPYVQSIGGVKMKVVASQIYYRYSKRRYLKFYTSFTRFSMKCFFHEALTHFGFVSDICVIDNTNLAILRGSGKNAVINPEMESFAKIYGFEWLAHEINHSDRKAGVERAFWTVETNFFPGRTFSSLENLNQQALRWCDKHAISANKKTKLIPVEVFEIEKSEMKKIPSHLPSPYIECRRVVDQYGYTAFDGNYYWIPKGTEGEVVVLQYASSITVYHLRKVVAEYALPAFGVKGQRFSPNGMKPANRPKKQSMPTDTEEAALKSLGTEVENYLMSVIKGTSRNRRYQIMRELFALHRRLAPSIFLKAVQRSLKYEIYDVKRLEAISVYILREDNLAIPDANLTAGYDKRESYLEGETTDEPNLAIYGNKYGGRNGQET